MTAETPECVHGAVQLRCRGDGVFHLVIDQPGSRVNVMNVAFIEDLERAVADLPSEARGLIVCSGKPDQFVAGADLDQLLLVREPEEAAEMVRRLHRVLNRIEALPYPSVAAINGAALGGGLEVALACNWRVCVESSSTILGLPEVQLGLLPAGGGSQRLPRLIGMSRALGLILEGKRYTPGRAKRYGVVDEVVHPAVLMEAAEARLAQGRRQKHPGWLRLDEAAARSALVRALIYRQAAKGIAARTRGHYPAPPAALDAVRAGQEQGFGAGLAAEAQAFGRLVTGDVAHNLIHLFFAGEGLKREQRGQAADAQTVQRVGVVGAGFMGAGIAQAAAAAGYGVRLRDLEPEQVARGIKTAGLLTRSAARKGRFSRSEAAEIAARLSGTTDYSGFGRCQLAIEAVFEDVAVKQAVIAELERALPLEAVIASNTSSLPIRDLAARAAHPERIVGMHFFSPVHKMPLLEVVRAERSSDGAVATAVEVGRAMGKTVIVVRDGPGFYTTRVLGFMVQEAGRLFEQGAAIEEIDRAMTHSGFPVGPLALTDEVGIDVAAHVSETLHRAFPQRFVAAEAINRMLGAGYSGRKGGAGFYRYDGKKKRPNTDAYALRANAPQRLPRDLIQRRLTLAFVNEAARCLAEGIIAGPRDGDVGAVMGIGFPPFLGGPFRYADRLGAAEIVRQLRQMEYAYGSSLAPAPLLAEMAETGATFYSGEAQRP